MRAFVLLCLLFSTSCSQTIVPPCTQINGWAMTMPYHISIGKIMSSDEHVLASAIINQAFSEVDQTLNNWNPHSEISEINRMPQEIIHTPSKHLAKILTLSRQVHTWSEGRFDPTINPLYLEWKRSLENSEEPEAATLTKIRNAVGLNHVHDQEGQLWKDEAATSLDFCALSKGYCIDLIVERLIEAGFNDVFVEWAGEIRANGRHPAGRDWIVQIEPMQKQTALINGAIATSGDYAQKDWGQGYFHIINPLEGRPLVKREGSIAAATVIAPTCALADAIATTLMIFETKDEAEKWAKRLTLEIPELSVWIFTHNPLLSEGKK